MEIQSSEGNLEQLFIIRPAPRAGKMIKSCAVIGYPSGQEGALLHGYNSTRALIGCWAGIMKFLNL